jgi:hypothetical protein
MRAKDAERFVRVCLAVFQTWSCGDGKMSGSLDGGGMCCLFFAAQIQVHAKFNKKRKQGDQYSDFNVAGSCSKWQLKESVVICFDQYFIIGQDCRARCTFLLLPTFSSSRFCTYLCAVCGHARFMIPPFCQPRIFNFHCDP